MLCLVDGYNLRHILESVGECPVWGIYFIVLSGTGSFIVLSFRKSSGVWGEIHINLNWENLNKMEKRFNDSEYDEDFSEKEIRLIDRLISSCLDQKDWLSEQQLRNALKCNSSQAF